MPQHPTKNPYPAAGFYDMIKQDSRKKAFNAAQNFYHYFYENAACAAE
ncbi:MAG: hypothetical protein ACLTQL_05215 [Eisenbergiella sp.]